MTKRQHSKLAVLASILMLGACASEAPRKNENSPLRQGALIAGTPGKTSLDPNMKLDLEKPELTAKQVRELAEKSTVSITAKNAISTISGTGFFVGKGLLITNEHVIGPIDLEKCTMMRYVTGELGNMYRPSRVIAVDKAHDLALVEVHPANISGYAPELADVPALKICDMLKHRPESGDKIYTFGGPKQLAGTFSDGIISALRDQGEEDSAESGGISKAPAPGQDADLYQITAPISHGSSGGPCLNTYGEIIGVTSSGIESGQNLNFAVSAKFIQPLLNKSYGLQN